MMRTPPLIIIGMHRSGTTLAVELLRKLGFFAGINLEQNLEPPFFITRNEWLMRRLGGSWDNPASSRALRLVPQYRDMAFEIMKSEIDSSRFRAFTGSVQPGASWGWKDPRNTFTASVWARVFPNASILHVYRNGIDVAISLQARELKIMEAGKHKLLSPRPVKSRLATAVRQFERYKIDSARCLVLDEGFKLWEEYIEEAHAFLDSYSGRKLSVCYENLLQNPVEHLRQVAEFAGLLTDTQSLEKASDGIRPERAFAYMTGAQDDAFTTRAMKSRWMTMLGYAGDSNA